MHTYDLCIPLNKDIINESLLKYEAQCDMTTELKVHVT